MQIVSWENYMIYFHGVALKTEDHSCGLLSLAGSDSFDILQYVYYNGFANIAIS